MRSQQLQHPIIFAGVLCSDSIAGRLKTTPRWSRNCSRDLPESTAVGLITRSHCTCTLHWWGKSMRLGWFLSQPCHRSQDLISNQVFAGHSTCQRSRNCKWDLLECAMFPSLIHKTRTFIRVIMSRQKHVRLILESGPRIIPTIKARNGFRCFDGS